MIDDNAIEVALTGMAGVAAEGISSSAYKRFLGIDPDGLRRFARDAADEEFTTLAGQQGRLQALGLTEDQEKAVRDALVETFGVAFTAAATIFRAEEMTR